MEMVTSTPPSTGETVDSWSAPQVVVILLCCAAYMLDGMDVLIMSYIAPSLARDWHVDPATLGIVFSAGFFGMLLGGLFVAPLADIIGRRPVILGSLLMMAIVMTATGCATSIWTMMILRGIVGIALGALVASTSALGAELAPKNRQSMAVGLIQTGYPLGSAITGVVSIWAIPAIGWHNVLIGAGFVTFLLVPIAYFLLPESTSFLIKKRPKNALVRVNRIRSKLSQQALKELPPVPNPTSSKSPINHLFANGLWRSTLLLWVSTIASSVALFFVISWIPKLAAQAGRGPTEAIIAGIVYNTGAWTGTLLMAVLAIRIRPNRITAILLFGGAVTLVIFGSLVMPAGWLLFVAFLIGVSVQGGFNSFPGLAALIYRAEIRSTGIGWAIGVGRGGAVLGPAIGGYLLHYEIPVPVIFAVFAVPLVIAGVSASFIQPRTRVVPE
jgi:benzoate transport